MINHIRHIGIIGAGLVGSLLSIYLARRGYHVSVFERRSDLRQENSDEGRSINLALSARGIRALNEVGLGSVLQDLAIPMHGRIMHDLSGNLTFLPYGRNGQHINSISRRGLNAILIGEAEKNKVEFFFQRRCSHVNLDETSVVFQSDGRLPESRKFDLLIGADGAFSAVRSAMQITERFNYSQYYLEHGYKELHIPPGASGEFLMEKNALHIWPRESFMMIGLPNPDGSFTCTLFFPFEEHQSFASLKEDRGVHAFFQKAFPDAVTRMPSLIQDYNSNPTSSLVTIKCFPWVKNNTLVIGDAAHAIVPFYGQGMNAGFEDCRILNQLLTEHDDRWPQVLQEFQKARKEDCDAIAELALDNFVEMRDLVADPEFLVRKKIEARLHHLYPDRWIPLYSMVTFHDKIRYSEAYKTGKKQAEIMDLVMQTPGISNEWENLDFQAVADRLS